MTKAEMEACQTAYQNSLAEARLALKAGLVSQAIKIAVASWHHIDGMMQHARRQGTQTFESIESIDLVLHYAPVVLASHSLDLLELLLKETRRIERDTSIDLGQHLLAARARLWRTYHLLDHLGRHPGSIQEQLGTILGGSREEWQRVAADAARIGLVRRTRQAGTWVLFLATSLSEPCPAKCSTCGTRIEAQKRELLGELLCPSCGNRASFVLLEPPSGE